MAQKTFNERKKGGKSNKFTFAKLLDLQRDMTLEPPVSKEPY